MAKCNCQYFGNSFYFFPTKGPNGEQGSAGIPGPFGPRVSNKT